MQRVDYTRIRSHVFETLEGYNSPYQEAKKCACKMAIHLEFGKSRWYLMRSVNFTAGVKIYLKSESRKRSFFHLKPACTAGFFDQESECGLIQRQ